MKLELLDKLGNDCHLKALCKTDECKETLYKIVLETAELKSDCIQLKETNDEPLLFRITKYYQRDD